MTHARPAPASPPAGPRPRRADAARSIVVNGVTLLPDPSGAVWWPERRLLAVADLHLEKGSGFAQRGRLLPPYDTAATLARLADLIGRWRPETVVCVGDSFHDGAAAGRLTPDDGARLTRLTRGRRWVWVAGNHDPVPPTAWGGEVCSEVVLGPLAFRHEARPGAAGEVSGHFHPKATVRARGQRVTAPCFAADGRRLVLPAFGAYTGGLDVLSPVLAGLFNGGLQVLLLGRERLHAFPRAALVAELQRPPPARDAGA